MRRQIAVALCSAVLGLAGLSLLVIVQQNAVPAALVADSSNAAGDRQVYASIEDLMESIIDPSADVIWEAVGTVVDRDEGIQELVPKTPEEWLDVRRAAVPIIEGGNLLMMPGREAAPPGTKSETPGVELEPHEITALMGRNRQSFDALCQGIAGAGPGSVARL